MTIRNLRPHWHRLLLLLAACIHFSNNTYAQPDNAKYHDLLLFSEFGELCAMCEAVVLCQQGDAIPDYTSIPEQGSFTLFHIETRSFWSQIATIWEWFINNFSEEPVSGHRRPVNIIIVDQNQWQPKQQSTIHVDIDPAYLTTESYQIERRQQQWLIDGELQGYCQRLPLWESLNTIGENSTATANREGVD